MTDTLFLSRYLTETLLAKFVLAILLNDVVVLTF